VNQNGHAASLEPHREGNTFAVKSGLYSRTGRVLAPRAEELAEDLLQRPHLLPLDPVVAEEIGSLLAALEAIDKDLAARGASRGGVARKTLLEHKARLTRELRSWLRECAITSKSQAEFGLRLAASHALQRKLQELDDE
jgi:hypothetical protein